MTALSTVRSLQRCAKAWPSDNTKGRNMQMPPEKGKAPVGGTTEALSEVTQDVNQGHIMSDSKGKGAAAQSDVCTNQSQTASGDLFAVSKIMRRSAGRQWSSKPILNSTSAMTQMDTCSSPSTKMTAGCSSDLTEAGQSVLLQTQACMGTNYASKRKAERFSSAQKSEALEKSKFTSEGIDASTPDLQISDGHVTTTSQQIAAHFGKRHADVIRAIRKMEAPADFIERNFALNEFTDSIGRKLPAYRITRDGFTLLAMGFTGKEAMHWKVAYLNAFNKMEQELLARTTRPHNPAIDYERISPAQAQDLKEIVEAIVQAGVQGRGETWTRLHRKFRVNKYAELPAAKHLEARKYLIAKLPNGVYEGVVFDAEPVKPQDSELLKSAFSLATEVAASAMRTVFDAVVDGKDVSKWDRWMFCLNHDREGKPTIPWAKPIQSDAMVVSMKELPTRILEPNGMMSSDEELANLASACTQRLAARAAFRMKQDSGRLTTV